MTLIRELFASDVTRDIPPVVFFGEQTPEKVAAEVSEYIITGGFSDGDPRQGRVPDGIHEQYVHLLNAITKELGKPGGTELPNAWISGFYGSGKSSFAKLLGLALDGMALPDGRSLAEAWLSRDTSPRRAELSEAWKALRAAVDPIAVVFDVGSKASDGAQVHGVALQEVQRRLGYAKDPLVADYELKLELEGQWEAFSRLAEEELGQPWEVAKEGHFADDDFSRVLERLFPERYKDQSWFDRRAGTHARSEGPEATAKAIAAMMKHRAPGKTLFMVVDEVSQYVLGNKDRVDRLRAFASDLGAVLKGQAWLLALGQQKLDAEAGDSFLTWAKDRFPPQLRVHLAPTNIRDVVYQRLLKKSPAGEAALRDLLATHRATLKLYGHATETASEDELLEVYPLMPGSIDLVLEVTSALRTRSRRAQGDDQAIRGLLQLLGELFRSEKIAEEPIGTFVTLDRVYEVQKTALDPDIQSSMARILEAAKDDEPLVLRAAKAVALLELIQDVEPTTAKLVSQCLYAKLGDPNPLPAVTEALESLRRRNLLGYSEKEGYRIQSSAGEEWERERRDIGVSQDKRAALIAAELKRLADKPEQPTLEGRKLPWAATLSDGRELKDHRLVDPRADAEVRVDFRYLPPADRGQARWVKESAERVHENRLLWVVGDTRDVEDTARELHRSQAMVHKYRARRESLPSGRRMQLGSEEVRAEELESQLSTKLQAAFLDGSLYFRGLCLEPAQLGTAFAPVLLAAANRVLKDMYSAFEPTQVSPGELELLIGQDLQHPPRKFLSDDGGLGILDVDAGRFVANCNGLVPDRIMKHLAAEKGASGAALLSHFGGPPFGYTPGLVKACVAGLLRGGKIKVQPESGPAMTAVRDADVKELFDKDRAFKRATLFPAGDDQLSASARNRIRGFFHKKLSHDIDRDDTSIANAAGTQLRPLVKRLREVQTQLRRVPGAEEPEALARLDAALEKIIDKLRFTGPTVEAVHKHLDALNDGFDRLRIYEGELSEDAVAAVERAHRALTLKATQLLEAQRADAGLEAAAARLGEQLQIETPWRNIEGVRAEVEAVEAAYLSAREAVMAELGEDADAARGELKRRDGFSVLSADDAHRVLRPIQQAVPETTPEAIAPTLQQLKDSFRLRLGEAIETAHATMDECAGPKVQTVRLELTHKEIGTPEELEAVLETLRRRILPLLEQGRVRLR